MTILCKVRTGAWLCLVGLGLAACFETEPLTEAASRGLQPAAGPTEVVLLDRSVTVVGPIGYCVDTEATRESDIEAFVLLVRCRGTLRPAPVLSATVTGLTAPTSNDPGALRRLAGFLSTPAGRAQLSRSGDPSEVTVVESTYANNAIWLLIEDHGNPESFDPSYWRAVLPIAGRIVTLSVLSAREHPLDSDSGLATLRSFVSRMRGANVEGG
ncbi:hypothetical protein [Pararhodobacter sp.]|uniref:hypothetical protein n=1 Tax=Pararhodobacter sp. TaxID=2127056 RepID=UPI002AFDD18A|nr:hypothetical protein [Pararhodobacter sp.]